MRSFPRFAYVFPLYAALAPAFVMASQTSSKSNSQPSAPTAQKNAPASHSTQPSEGDRIFQQNCSRCHNAPEGFSPRISGTIVRHMRVRASLSQHDEQELLRFFNP